MADNLKMEDLEEEVVPTSETTEEEVETEVEGEPETEVETEQDPLKTELERVQKGGRTEKEKAEFSLKKNAERVKELGGDPNLILGMREEEPEDEDDKPITKGELKKMMTGRATKTALQLAEDIENTTERELVKYYIENRIQPSGNPQEDLRDARRMVNSLKNEQIISEAKRKSKPKSHSNGSGVDARREKDPQFSLDELAMMRPPFNMSQAQVLEARAGKNFAFKNSK